MELGRMAFDETSHPRAPKGTGTGGEFAPKKQSAGAKKTAKGAPAHGGAAHHRPQHSATLSYDAKSKTGTGYGVKGGDPRVRSLQEALNRLGLADSKGRKLTIDGKLGPLTTAAVKAAQKRLGVAQDGHVTPALLAALAKAKKLPRRSAGMDLCVRSFTFETRGTSPGDGRTLEGYAAVFDTPTRIRDLKGDFDEVIRPGAFARSLTERTPLLQWDHGKDPRIGTVPIGAFEDIREDGNGLYVRARLFDHPDVARVQQAIAGQAVKGMSFRFGVPDNGDAWTPQDTGVDLREIRDADIHECGPVAFPAYDTTTVTVRSLLAQLDAQERRALVHELAADVRTHLTADGALTWDDALALTVDLEDLTGGSDARSADRGEHDAQPGNGAASPAPQLHLRQRLDDGALRARGILR